MPTTLSASAIQTATAPLRQAETAAQRHPGAFESASRSTASTAAPNYSGPRRPRSWGPWRFAPSTSTRRTPAGWPRSSGSREHAATVRERVADKLRREPIEDYRIDFEDGYGNRSDEEEDGHAVRRAGEVASPWSRARYSLLSTSHQGPD